VALRLGFGGPVDTQWASAASRGSSAAIHPGAFFIFIFFENIFYRNIFSISQFTVLYPYRPAGGGRGPAAQQRGGRDLYVNFKKIYLRGSLWREPAAPLAGGRPPAANPLGGRPPAARQGGRQAPQSCIKGFPSPSPLICFPRHPESGRERGGVRERVVTAKPCRILDPNRR